MTAYDWQNWGVLSQLQAIARSHMTIIRFGRLGRGWSPVVAGDRATEISHSQVFDPAQKPGYDRFQS